MGGQSNWLLWGGAIVLVIALSVLALNREPEQLDPDTAEGVVQIYLTAVDEKDWESAFEILDPEFTEGCNAADLERAAPAGPFTAVVVDSYVEAPSEGREITYVSVTIDFGDGGLFDDGGRWEQFSLLATGGSWLITDWAWPYMGPCEEGL